jgi:hypothetical protein
MTPRRCPVPDQTTLSIKAEVAPRVRRGLYAIVRKRLERAADRERSGGGGDHISNKLSADVRGTLFQIGKVHGNIYNSGDGNLEGR